MKKNFAILISLFLTIFFSVSLACAETDWEKQIREDMGKPVYDEPTKTSSPGGMMIDMKSAKQKNGKFAVKFDLGNIKLVPKDNTKATAKDAKSVALVSAAREQNNGKEKRLIAKGDVKNEKFSFAQPNFAEEVGVPFVDNIFGSGMDMDNNFLFLLLNPNHPLVVYKISKDSTWIANNKDRVNLNTLSISYVTYPNGNAFPLKAVMRVKVKQLSTEKLENPNAPYTQGPAPELALSDSELAEVKRIIIDEQGEEALKGMLANK